MTRSPNSCLIAAFALLIAGTPAAVAQEVVQPLPGTTDADRLADTMRRLATNPRDVDALVRAGELSMGLGDLSGAAALFARAEKVDARDGRVKAGMASILVRSERPGEALRYFAQAESFGLAPRAFAADRALAYDLIGQQDRAQRDYRVALRDAPADETIRRYALSLGISGKQQLALEQLAPLIEKSDRGAWRARAFILAMTGDVAGASYIATTMMPAGMSQGLQPFFQRLPTLAAADRAFAVHFGEVHASADRIADARMTPPLPALGPDPTAPVMVAVQPSPAVQIASADTSRRGRRERKAASARTAVGRTAIPEAAAPVRIASVPAATVAATTSRVQSPSVTQVTAGIPQPTTAVGAVPAPVVVTQALRPTQRLVPAATATSTAPSPVAVAQVLPSAQRLVPAATAGVSVKADAQTIPMGEPPRTVAASATSRPAATQATGAVASILPTADAPSPGFSSIPMAAATPTPTPTSMPAATPVTTRMPPVAATPAQAGAAREDTILARIIASLSIPASELDVVPPPAPATAGISQGAQRVLTEAKAKTDRDLAAKKLLDQELAADRKVAARKAVADRKALAEKKAAAEKKAIADKEAAEEKRIARANPSRIWVQVSTGATEGDLPKAWKGAKAKAPLAFGGRSGWTTPWRATNRVLAGPFRTDAEARTFVNQLAKEGVSTFSFKSDPGQVITKLPSK